MLHTKSHCHLPSGSGEEYIRRVHGGCLGHVTRTQNHLNKPLSPHPKESLCKILVISEEKMLKNVDRRTYVRMDVRTVG